MQNTFGDVYPEYSKNVEMLGSAIPHRLSEVFEKNLSGTSELPKYAVSGAGVSCIALGKGAAVQVKVNSDYGQLRALILVPNSVTGNKQKLKPMHKRIEITIETERYLVVAHQREATILFCHQCNKTVPMLTVFEAARIANTTTSVISRWLTIGSLHFAVGAEAQIFVCPNSLASESSVFQAA